MFLRNLFTALFIGPFFLLGSNSITTPHCLSSLIGQSPQDPLAFKVEHNFKEEMFLKGKLAWDRARFEQVAFILEPNGKFPVLYEGFFKLYRETTGINLEVKLDLELSDFLAQKGIDPKTLILVGEGMQGALYTHPLLGNSVIKVSTVALQNAEYCDMGAFSLGEGSKKGADIHLTYNKMDGLREKMKDQLDSLNRYQNNLKRFYRVQASQSLHRAHQLMLPGLLAAQANLKYFDFARVYLIGNGFFVREYYPDSKDSQMSLARKLLDENGKSIDHPSQALREIQNDFPVINEITLSLVTSIPSFFVSETLYNQTKNTNRPRLFIIYDLD